MSTDNLKLIYVLKVGKNSKGEGIYEFIFSKDIENVDVEMWNWDESPAIEHKEHTIPDPEYVDATFSLTTKDFALFCLHDATDRPYMHGYHLIHALAYEDEDSEDLDDDLDFDYEDMMEDNADKPLLVFHYGMTFKAVEDKLYERNIILRGEKFINTSALAK
jgi:hypothetical protein